MSANPVTQCLTTDDVRRIIREETRTDRQRIESVDAKIDRLATVVATLKRGALQLAGLLKE